MRDFPTDSIRQNDRLIAALCTDWLAAGTTTRDTPRADRVIEISRQLRRDAPHSEDGEAA
jgi:hypothetical protein